MNGRPDFGLVYLQYGPVVQGMRLMVENRGKRHAWFISNMSERLRTDLARDVFEPDPVVVEGTFSGHCKEAGPPDYCELLVVRYCDESGGERWFRCFSFDGKMEELLESGNLSFRKMAEGLADLKGLMPQFPGYRAQ